MTSLFQYFAKSTRTTPVGARTDVHSNSHVTSQPIEHQDLSVPITMMASTNRSRLPCRPRLDRPGRAQFDDVKNDPTTSTQVDLAKVGSYTMQRSACADREYPSTKVIRTLRASCCPPCPKRPRRPSGRTDPGRPRLLMRSNLQASSDSGSPNTRRRSDGSSNAGVPCRSSCFRTCPIDNRSPAKAKQDPTDPIPFVDPERGVLLRDAPTPRRRARCAGRPVAVQLHPTTRNNPLPTSKAFFRLNVEEPVGGKNAVMLFRTVDGSAG
jgi:hypothetical protein